MEENENEVSLTDSAVMDDSGVQLTPTSTKYNSKFDNDVMSFLQKQFSELKEQNIKFERRFDNNDDCLRTMSNEMKQQNVHMNKRLNEIDEHCSTIIKQIQDGVNAVSYTHLDVYKRQVCVCVLPAFLLPY